MPGPHVCPICKEASLERILADVQIAAKVKGIGQNVVNGIVAYLCTENGHIFFLRDADVRVETYRAEPLGGFGLRSQTS